MSEDAKPRALLTVFASGALLLTLGGWASMLYLTGEAAGKREAVAAGQHVPDRTLDREIAACRQSGTPMAQCAREVAERAREAQIDEQTLAAQADAADWAWWLLLLAALQMPISGLGLFALWRTLRQGQLALVRAHDANEIASAHGYAQLRAYISFNGFKVTGEDADGIDTSLTVANLGNTPAKNSYLRMFLMGINFPLVLELGLHMLGDVAPTKDTDRERTLTWRVQYSSLGQFRPLVLGAPGSLAVRLVLVAAFRDFQGDWQFDSEDYFLFPGAPGSGAYVQHVLGDYAPLDERGRPGYPR